MGPEWSRQVSFINTLPSRVLGLSSEHSSGPRSRLSSRTLSISAPGNYVYRHVYIYFLAAGQARAVGSLESGNLVVYGPLQTCQRMSVRVILIPLKHDSDSIRLFLEESGVKESNLFCCNFSS